MTDRELADCIATELIADLKIICGLMAVSEMACAREKWVIFFSRFRQYKHKLSDVSESKLKELDKLSLLVVRLIERENEES